MLIVRLRQHSRKFEPSAELPRSPFGRIDTGKYRLAPVVAFVGRCSILRGSDHEMAQKLSRAIHRNAGGFDGILYQSRFLMGECIAVFDRAIPKLQVVKSVPLSRLTGSLKPIFKGMGLKIVR